MKRNIGRGDGWRSLLIWERQGGLILVILLSFLMASCSSTYKKMPADEKRAFLEDLEAKTLTDLMEIYPEAGVDRDNAVGYAVFSNRMTKIPMVGAGEGLGVVVDTATETRTYLKVGRFDVGGGLGVRSYRIVIFFFEKEILEDLADGALKFGGGIEAGAGSKGLSTDEAGAGATRKDGYAYYVLSDEGVSATFTVRMTQYKVIDLAE